MLFDGISTADDRPMVIVPHGALQDVPFEVLTLQNRMVIERHAVSYAPSLNALVQLRRLPANTAPFRVLWNSNESFAAEFVQRFNREMNQGHSSEEAIAPREGGVSSTTPGIHIRSTGRRWSCSVTAHGRWSRNLWLNQSASPYWLPRWRSAPSPSSFGSCTRSAKAKM